MFDSKRVEQLLQISTEEQWPYSKTFDALKVLGVEYYTVDVPEHRIVYYGAGKSWQALSPSDFQRPDVGMNFDGKAVRAAIRSNQLKETDYKQFLEQIAMAGVTTYRVDMATRTIDYQGTGGNHIVEVVPPFES